MPIEYYSPVSGGAVATVIAGQAVALELLGAEVSVWTYVDGTGLHSGGVVRSLGPMPRRRAALLGLNRLLSNRMGQAARQKHFARKLREALESLTVLPDWVLVHNDWQTVSLLRSALPQMKIALWLHNELPVPDEHRPAPTLILAVSEYVRGACLAQGLEADRVVTILNGVDVDVFSQREPGSSSNCKVLTVGRLDPNKGHHLALESVARLRAEGVHISCTLAGGAWWYQTRRRRTLYEQELLSLLPAADGSFVGLLPRYAMPPLYQAHDVVLVLSLSQEPFGLVALEAMASGCAVVVSERGGLREVVGSAGLVVEPTDAEGLDAALRHLVADKQARAAMAARARVRSENFTWDVRAKQLLRTLEQTSEV